MAISQSTTPKDLWDTGDNVRAQKAEGRPRVPSDGPPSGSRARPAACPAPSSAVAAHVPCAGDAAPGHGGGRSRGGGDLPGPRRARKHLCAHVKAGQAELRAPARPPAGTLACHQRQIPRPCRAPGVACPHAACRSRARQRTPPLCKLVRKELSVLPAEQSLPVSF